MNVVVLNKLIAAADSVSQMMLNIELRAGRPQLMDKAVAEESICILVGTTGELRGQVVISCNQDVALRAANRMMQGMGSGQWDELAQSALQEFGNMTMGTFSTLLSQEEINIDITPPTMIQGEGITLSGEKGIKLPMYNKQDESDVIYLTLMMREGA